MLKLEYKEQLLNLDNNKYIEFIINEYYNNIEFLYKLVKKFEIKYDNNLLNIYNKYKKNLFYVLKKISKITLIGGDEIYDKHAANTSYYTILCNNEINLKSFKLFILFYYIDSLISKELYLPMDCEFNTNKNSSAARSFEIALMQLNFENDKENFIYIFYPPKLDNDTNLFLKHNIFNNKYIKIILHGGDSLDIPYLFYTFFKNNKEEIIKFANNLIDTKYLCEYYHNDKEIDAKCKIKDILLELNIINQKKMDYLVENEIKMGNISEINIDINNISDELLKYSLYDVIYLKYLFLKFKKIDNYIYGELIPEMTSYVYLDRRGIINITEKVDKIIYRLNLGKIEDFDDNLSNIFMTILYVVYDSKIMNIFKINYFKKNIETLLKIINYNILIANYKIIMPNNTEFNGYINIGSIFKSLRLYNMMNIFKLLNYYKEEINKYLI